MSMAKLCILLKRLGMKAISLTGWQAGILTNDTNQDAIIEDIDTSRIEKELDNGNIVIVAGFQGINRNMDITTLGRGGSDTTAVAIAAKINADHCYIFSDVDGVYSADPKKTKIAKKIDTISYAEMLDIADEGAKVLHNRCVEVGLWPGTVDTVSAITDEYAVFIHVTKIGGEDTYSSIIYTDRRV